MRKSKASRQYRGNDATSAEQMAMSPSHGRRYGCSSDVNRTKETDQLFSNWVDGLVVMARARFGSLAKHGGPWSCANPFSPVHRGMRNCAVDVSSGVA
jgi:hypothetical protein